MSNLDTRLAKLETATVGKAKLRGFIGPHVPGQRHLPDGWDVIELENGLRCFRTKEDYAVWCAAHQLDPDAGILLRIIFYGEQAQKTLPNDLWEAI